jgi:hypothetical protein
MKDYKMPYIKQHVREELDDSIEELVSKITRLTKVEGRARDGILNYVFTQLSLQSYSSVSYSTINEVIGVLECCKLEFYRRLASEYENEKVSENGDVY